MVTRRRFLTLGAAGVVSAGLLGDVARGSAVLADLGNKNLNAYSFERDIGKSFVIKDRENGTTSVLKLIEVKEIKSPADKNMGIKRESCSLLFEGSKSDLLDQGVYEFIDRSMPDAPLLVVPVTADAGIYEVNFNFFRS